MEFEDYVERYVLLCEKTQILDSGAQIRGT